MNTTHNRKKTIAAALGAAAAAVATPVMLFAGAGTAQAGAPIPPSQSKGPIKVNYVQLPLGLQILVTDNLALPGGEVCSYQSVGNGALPFPYSGAATIPPGAHTGELTIPLDWGTLETTEWNVSVNCPGGGEFDFTERY
jgi:hypothetical protein